jgi:molybdopterin-guanine dinucleotide biosynthesis protein A
MEWAAVILSGGTAARMDGTDKASLEYAGRSLLEHALDAVAAADEIVVVGPEMPTSRPVTFTRESPPGGGPLAGLRAGVSALEHAPHLVVVLAADMPHVTAMTVARLLAAAGGTGGSCLVDGDARRHLAAVVTTEAVLAFADPHGRPMRALFESYDVRPVLAIGRETEDVDTWDDLTRLRT